MAQTYVAEIIAWPIHAREGTAADLHAAVLSDFDTTQIVESVDVRATGRRDYYSIRATYQAVGLPEARAAARRAARATGARCDVRVRLAK